MALGLKTAEKDKRQDENKCGQIWGVFRNPHNILYCHTANKSLHLNENKNLICGTWKIREWQSRNNGGF